MIRILRVAFLLLLLGISFASAKVLTSISIEGLQNEREKTVLSMMPLRVGEPFTSNDIQETIKQLYRSGRFRTVKVFAVDEADSTSGVHVVVEENAYVYDVEMTGFKKLKEPALREGLTLKRGELLTDVKLFDNVVALRKKYSEKGYLKADVSVELVETSVPGSMIVKFTIDEQEKVRVEKVTFVGNEVFDEKKLRRKFKTKERHVFSSGEFKEDEYRQHLDSLIVFYNEEGYMDARVVEETVNFLPDSSGLELVVRLHEGRQFFAGDFFFQNNTVIDDSVLQMSVAMRKGKPFERTKFQMTQQAVSNAYRNEGYLWSSATPEYKFRGDTVDVVFSIVEGRPAIVRKINITGNEKTREQVIRRELRIFPGQKFSQADMERSIREVFQLNYFDNVVPDITPYPDGTIDLIFDVKEKDNIGQFSAGITYSQVDRFGGNFSVSIPNFRGAGEQLDAMIELSRRMQRYSVGFMEPWIFNRPTSFSSRLFYEKVEDVNTSVNNNNYERAGIELGLGKGLKWPDDYFSVSARYLLSYDYNKVQNQSEWEDILNINIPVRGVLNRFYLGITRDDTDFPQFPTKGSRFSLGGYLGTSFPVDEDSELEEYNFIKAVVSYDWYVPLFWKVSLGSKVKFGAIGALSGESPSLGYGDLFKVGGVYYDGVVRGYPDGSYLGNPNLTMLTLSAELRFPIIDQQFYMAGFFDAGNAWNAVQDVSLSELYPGAGVGFRLMLPMVGLLGFDFAYGFKNKTYTEFWQTGDVSGFQFHFVMNKGF